GSVHVHPEGAPNDTNCVVAGTASVKVKFAASFGPLFATVATNDIVCPLSTGFGLAAIVVTRFAPGNCSGLTIPVYANLCCKPVSHGSGASAAVTPAHPATFECGLSQLVSSASPHNVTLSILL